MEIKEERINNTEWSERVKFHLCWRVLFLQDFLVPGPNLSITPKIFWANESIIEVEKALENNVGGQACEILTPIGQSY